MPLRLGFLADCQLGCAAGFSGLSAQQRANIERDHGLKVPALEPMVGFDWDLAQLERAIGHCNKLQPELVIVGGDMVDDATDDEQYSAMIAAFAELQPPVYWAAGNHDTADDGVIPTHDSMARYRKRHGDDLTEIVHPEATLIIMNTPVLAWPDNLADEVANQFAWLEQRLAAAQRRQVPTIVFGHHPLFVNDPDEPDSYWNLPVALRHRTIELLAKAGVSAYFCGHLHRNATPKGAPFAIVVAAAVGLPLGDDPSGLTMIDVEGDTVTHRFISLDDLDRGVRP